MAAKQSLRYKFFRFRFSDLPQINLFITTARSNNRFNRMENTLIDWSGVARELIQDASRSCIPYVNHPIWTPRCDFASIRWPATLQQVLFKVVLVPFHYLHTPILWCIWTHIPYTVWTLNLKCLHKPILQSTEKRSSDSF